MEGGVGFMVEGWRKGYRSERRVDVGHRVGEGPYACILGVGAVAWGGQDTCRGVGQCQGGRDGFCHVSIGKADIRQSNKGIILGIGDGFRCVGGRRGIIEGGDGQDRGIVRKGGVAIVDLDLEGGCLGGIGGYLVFRGCKDQGL